MVLIAGLIGVRLAPDESLSTLPYAMVVIGTACAAIPAAMIMSKIGRKKGVYLGLCIALFATVLAIHAINTDQFWPFVMASFLFGTNAAFAQQGRFIILENARNEKEQADGLTLALLANLVAAFLGPWMGLFGRELHHALDASMMPFTGSFLLLLVMLTLAGIGLMRYQEVPLSEEQGGGAERSLKDILCQRGFIIASGSAAFGFAIMAFVMTATPVSMNQLQGHGLDHTTWVIQSHIVAMFLPSLITGRLLKQGLRHSLIVTGFLIYLVMVIVASTGQHVMHYWWALVLLGLGWNLIFMTSTTLLGHTHSPSEKFKVQAANDFLVFSFQAIAAFSAGFVLFSFGWSSVVLTALTLTTLWLVVLGVAGRNRQ